MSGGKRGWTLPAIFCCGILYTGLLERGYLTHVRRDTSHPVGADLRIAVGIATIGRAQLLQATLDALRCQSRRGDRIIICAPTADDIVEISDCDRDDIRIIVGPRGLTCQRNAILDQAAEFDLLVFFDDDFIPAPSYLQAIDYAFTKHPEIAVATGTVLRDGILGPGLSLEEAATLLAKAAPLDTEVFAMHEVANGYGCNMTLRVSAILAASARFDERLPLYGWLEDVDFSRQLVDRGRIVKLAAAQGVHLGIKKGRQSGVRLGYSQVANPIYLSRKGTFPWTRAIRLMSRNIAANCIGSLRPEAYIDRVGRVRGNVRAIRDLLSGRLAPERILEL